MTRGGRIVRAAAVLALALSVSGCTSGGSPDAGPNRVASADLVESPATYDGVTVEFTGEAVGEAMVRGEMAWVHLNDDAYYMRNVEEGAPLGGYNSGMAVWLPAESARRITYFGDHAHEGDVVTVRGVFNAACLEHGGDTDIHADDLTVVTVGRMVEDPVHPGKLAWAVGLALLAGVVFAAYRWVLR